MTRSMMPFSSRGLALLWLAADDQIADLKAMIHRARPFAPEQLSPSREALEVAVLSPSLGLSLSARTSPRVTK